MCLVLKSARWKIWGPNGGYLSAIALRAVQAKAADLVPVSLHTEYMRVAKFGKVDLFIAEIRRGRSVASYEVRMMQGDKAIIRTCIILAKENDGMVHDHVAQPTEINSFEKLPLFERNEDQSPYWDNFNLKPVNWNHGSLGVEPVSKTWFEFKGDGNYQDLFLDCARSALLIDTMLWPAAHQIYEDGFGYVAPSLDLYVKFHRLAPQSSWLFCDAHAPLAERGLLSGDAQIFDEKGRLLASGGSQMYCQKLP